MTLPDYLVLGGYFLMMIGIGAYCATQINKQEDFFLGGRGFGKLLQTFAAFGAGTGSSDPVNTGRTTFTGGMSGMWSVMFWLFVTPFYWITGVWYRRMRHLTLGDWFVERYESRGLGAAYSIFGVLFFMIYGSMFFSAIAKTAEPMMSKYDSGNWSCITSKPVLSPPGFSSGLSLKASSPIGISITESPMMHRPWIRSVKYAAARPPAMP